MRAHSCLLVLLLALPVAASDWLQFRGPNASGVGGGKPLPADLGNEDLLLWRTPLPPGHSSPVLAAGRVFLTAVEGDELLTVALDRATGKILWRKTAPRSRVSKTHRVNNAAASSVVSDGENVYTFFGDFGLISYSADGHERWRLPLGPFHNGMGMAASPVLAGGRLVLVCDQDFGSYMAAIDPNNGELLWKTGREEYTRGFSTPTIYHPPSGETEIIVPGSYELAGYSLASGEKLWWVRGLSWQVKSVAVLGDGVVYAHGWAAGGDGPPAETQLPEWRDVLARHDRNGDKRIGKDEAFLDRMRKKFGSFDLDKDGVIDARDWRFARARDESRNALLAVKLGGRGDLTGTNVLWRFRKTLPNVPSPLLYQGVIYLIKDGGIFTSLDAQTGEPIRQGRLRGGMDKYFASPVAGDGKIYLADAGGNLTVVSARGDWEVLAEAALGAGVMATPAIADGGIYIRTQESLLCYSREARPAAE